VTAPRPLGAWTAVLLGTNAIVGSGVYLFPAPLAERLGALSSLAWVATALLCAPIALAYAQMARQTDRSGGAYRYAADCFGAYAGALLGWVSWVAAVVSWAAVANAVPAYLGHFVAPLGPGPGGKAAAGTLVAGLAVVNVLGVRLGAGVSNALTIGKVVPLLVLAAAALAAPLAPSGQPAPPSLPGDASFGAAVLMILFAYQGFEVVGIPAGEIREPRRAVARGVLGSVAFAAVLYVLVQVAYLGAGAPAGDAPLAEAARVHYGAAGATLLGLGGLVSIVGFNAGTAVGSPRYLSALAEDGWMPRGLAAAHPRFGTPAGAVLCTGAVTLAVALLLDFERLVDIANVAVLVQYAATSSALVVARRGHPAWTAVGVLAVAASLVLLVQAKASELVTFALSVILGAAVLAVLRRFPHRA